MSSSYDPPAKSDPAERLGANSHAGAATRRSPLVWMALAAIVAMIAVVLLLQFFVANRIPDLTIEALEAAEARWEEYGPASYDVDFEIRGAQPGVVHVEVRGGEVTAMTRDGNTPRQPRTWVYWSVPGRFEEIEREFDLAEDPVHEMNADAGTRVKLRCEFDSELGYPRTFHRMIFGGGPEVYWQVTQFEPK